MARGHRPGGNRRPDEKPQDMRGAAKRFLGAIKPLWALLLLESVLMIGGTITGVAPPAFLGKATDAILDADMERLVQNLSWALGLALVSAVLSYLAHRVNRSVVQSFAYKLRGQASSKINRLPVTFLENREVGDLVSRITNDVDNIAQTLQQVIGRALESLITVVAVLTLMIWISPWLALLSVLVLPLVGVGVKVIMSKSQPYFRQQWSQTGVVSTLVEESFSGQQILSLHGLAPNYAKRFRRENDTLTNASFRAQFISMLMQPMLTLVTNLSYVIIAVAGALFVLSGSMTIGGVQAFIQYSRNLTNPLAAAMQILNLMQSALASSERLFAFMDEADSEIETDAGTLAAIEPSQKAAHLANCEAALAKGTISFENVTFSYEPNKPVIKNFNLTVHQGDSVAIVGPTGAGKTTLVNLLVRYVDPDSGRISINGVDIKDIPVEMLRSRIGMVTQEPWLVDATISENIAFGTQVEPARLKAAANRANLDSLVAALPQGYDTPVDNDSEALSAGEKQLLTIARAFYAQRSVLILDEATSAVDTRTELLLAKALERLGEGRTTFTIAHRLSTIRGADVILVMEDGRLVESGSHEELLGAHGAYWRLYDSQFRNV